MFRAIIAAVLTLLAIGSSRSQERPPVPPTPQVAQPPLPLPDPRCALGRCQMLYGGTATYAVLRFCNDPVRVPPRAPTS